METKASSMSFTYDNRIASILERFHLNHLARLGNIKIDRDLITAVAERWRRETHSFHFPTDEMTITLEDVLMLWGLPLDGLPVTGDVDQD
jgi:Plant mobile domain